MPTFAIGSFAREAPAAAWLDGDCDQQIPALPPPEKFFQRVLGKLLCVECLDKEIAKRNRSNCMKTQTLEARQPMRINATTQLRVLDREVLVVATPTVGGWKAYIGVVPGRNHDEEWKHVLNSGSTLAEDVARFLFPDFANREYDR